MSIAILQRALDARRAHLSAFLVLGDPTPELSVELAVAAVDAGATMLELGIPYRDPCADGPAIQRSCARALAAGSTTAGALAVLGEIHRRLPEVPLNLLVYGNLVHARGYQRFCRELVRCGAATLLVPDIPSEESGLLRLAAAQAQLGHVSLITPSTTTARLRRLDAETTGFLYLAGYQGVTGASGGDVVHSFPAGLEQAVNPVCLGFGVSRPVQVRDAIRNGARMVVVGSHLARVIEARLTDPVPQFHAAVAELAAAATDDVIDIDLQPEGESKCS